MNEGILLDIMVGSYPIILVSGSASIVAILEDDNTLTTIYF